MLPLENVKVVSFGQAVAGPYGGMMLADMGADVVKIEPPGIGDHVRKWSRADLHGHSPHFLSSNRNKRSIVIDLKKKAGVDLALDLIRRADVLIENFTPGTMASLGLGYPETSAVNPRLIYSSVSGYGQNGPYSDRSAYDLIIQGEGGLISLTGTEDGQMAKVGVPVLDVMTAMVSAYSIVCALIERGGTGAGRYLDISMLEVATSVMSYNLIDYAVSGKMSKPLGTRHPILAPYQVYPTATNPITVGVLAEPHWASFCELIGREDLRDNPDYVVSQQRVVNLAALNRELMPIFASKPAEYWSREFRRRGLVCGDVNDVAGLLKHPQLKAREYFQTFDLGGGTTVDIPGMPWRFAGANQPKHRPPELGEHTNQILADWLGMNETAIAEARRLGALG
ncbi:MAG: CoA transferase [Alphaproteobacteria bacterium]